MKCLQSLWKRCVISPITSLYFLLLLLCCVLLPPPTFSYLLLHSPTYFYLSLPAPTFLHLSYLILPFHTSSFLLLHPRISTPSHVRSLVTTRLKSKSRPFCCLVKACLCFSIEETWNFGRKYEMQTVLLEFNMPLVRCIVLTLPWVNCRHTPFTANHISYQCSYSCK